MPWIPECQGKGAIIHPQITQIGADYKSKYAEKDGKTDVVSCAERSKSRSVSGEIVSCLEVHPKAGAVPKISGKS